MIARTSEDSTCSLTAVYEYSSFDVVIKLSLQEAFYVYFAIILIYAFKELPYWGETIGRNRHPYQVQNDIQTLCKYDHAFDHRHLASDYMYKILLQLSI